MTSQTKLLTLSRVQNLEHPEAEDGCLFVIDLAGSENAADSQFHNKDRLKVGPPLLNQVVFYNQDESNLKNNIKESGT